MADHRYFAELGIDAGTAVKAFGETAKEAQGLQGTLDALDGALKRVGGTSEKTAEKTGRTLKLYQQLSSAVGAYARAAKTLASPEAVKGQQQMGDALANMRKELQAINAQNVKDPIGGVKGIQETLNLYKQLAQASSTYSGSLRNEAQAIKAVADAEANRARISQQAASAATRGVDIWGVGKDERAERQRANVQMQARREMEAEFARRRELVQQEGVMQTRAQREMEAEFARREKAQAKATAEQEKATQATQKGAAAEDEYERGLAATRYALYEIAAAYTAVSAAALALPVSSAKAAIEMEAQFAHVARTTQAAEAPLAQLRDRFVDLSTEIPVSFEELSKIGTLGAQMGIAAGDLESFADTVAKFSATTDVSVDQAAMSFGRLSNMMHLTEADYESLGSAISELGTASVSTESEILAIAESIGTTANMAGFTAYEVVGLSTAMASLRIRPEMARGALMRVFRNITTAAAEGNETLTAYAQTLGMTEQAAADLWENDPSRFFQRLAQSLDELDNASRTLALPELGINNARDVELINRLANGYEVYADSMTLAQDAYARGDYLEAETGVIFETTAASLEKLGSAFRGMLDSFGQDSLGPVQLVAEVLIRLMNAIRDLPSWAKGSTVALLAVVGAVAAMRAAIALSLASLRAFRLVNQQLNIDSTRSMLTLRNLNNEFRQTFPAANTAAAGVRSFTAQLSAAQGVMARTGVVARGMWTAIGGPIGLIGIIASVGAAVWGLVNAHESAASAAKAHADSFIENAGGMESLMQALRKDAEEFASGVQTEVLGELNVQLRETEPAAKTAADVLQGTLIPAHEDQAEAVRDTTDAYLEGIGAIGKYADAWMRQGLVDALVASDDIDADSLTALIERGFDFEELIHLWESEGVEAARAYTQTFADEYARHYEEHDYASDQAAAIEGGLVRTASLAAEAVKKELVDLNYGLDDVNTRFLATSELGIDMFDDATEGAAGLNEEVDSLADSFNDLVSEMFGLVDAEAAVYAAMEKLGQSLDENGNSFDIMTEKGRANMDALQSLISAVGEDIAAQVESGAMTAEAGAQAFGMYVESIVADLGAMGVDTSQFDFFRDHLDTLFAPPVVVDVEVDQALNKLEALQTYAIQVLNNIAAQSDGVRGAVARWGAGAVKSAQRTVRTKIAAPDVAKRRQVNLNREAAEYQRQNTTQLARSRAEQERLAKGAEKANKSTRDTADQAKRLKEQIAEASDEGRIFEETMKELRSAFSDTLDRFGGHQSARDTMEGQLHAMRNAAQQAREEVKSLRDEARSLRQEARDSQIEAEQAEIFAAVARRYGDTTRYNEYSNEARKARENAKEKNRLASAAEKEATALDRNRNALTGYSEQAIKNREDVRRLQSTMADLIIAYAETGATTEEVTRYAEDLRRKFIDQLTQMGYNRRDVVRLSDVFKDLKRDIDRVPREVRIRAQAEVDEARRKLNDLAKGRTVPVTVRATNDNLRMSGSMEANKMNIRKEITTPRVRSSGHGGGAPYAMFAGGGQLPGSYSGPLNKDDKLVVGPNGPEASVRSGEWVMPVPAVNHYGKDFMHAVQTMKFNPIVRVQTGAGAGSGIQDVNLLPHNIQQIARAVSTVLAVDGKVIAATTNGQNTNAARRGTR